MDQTKKSLVSGCWNKILFTFVCGCCMLLVSIVRSGPVYGKLDFILIDSKNWWHEMRPMFEEVLVANSQPVYTDHMTRFIFKRFFGQKMYKFRNYENHSQLNITKMNTINRPFSERAMLQTIYTSLLLAEASAETVKNNTEMLNAESFAPELSLNQEEVGEKTDRHKRPYRCVINLKGFTPTWVPIETRHWRVSLAQTSRYYYLQAETGGNKITGRQKIIGKLQKTPLKNCIIYK